MTAVLKHPGYEEERLQRVTEQLPCREVQVGLLLSLMGQVRRLVSTPVRRVALSLVSNSMLF